MRLDSGRISRAQAVYTLVLAIVGTGTFIMPGGLIKAAGRDAWLAALVAAAFALIPGYLWIWVAGRHPEQDLFQLPLTLVGRVLGRAINVILLIWILIVVLGSTWLGADLIVTSYLPETPRVVVIASIMLPAAYAAYLGVETVARLSQLAFWWLIVSILAVLLVGIRDLDLLRVLPVLGAGPGPVLKGTMVPVILMENTMLAALVPFLIRPQAMGRLLVTVSALSGGIIALLALICVLVFGADLPSRFPYPGLMVAHVISVGDILERLDALMVAVWVTGNVAKVSFWSWLLYQGTTRLFGLRDYRPLVWPAALLLISASLGYARNATEAAIVIRSWGVLGLPTVGILIPALLLGLSAWRGTCPRQDGAST